MKSLPGLPTLLLILFSLILNIEAAPLKEGDIVAVSVFGEPSLSGSFTISPKGHVVYPLLGNIDAAGKTTEELAAKIKAALEVDYIRSAQVVAALTKTAPHSVSVIGQVMNPQQVSFPAGESIDILTAIASAGGLTDRANASRIELKRRSGNNLVSEYLSLTNNRVFKLKDGDTLIITANPIVDEKTMQATITVIGQVNKPGNITINPDNPLDLIGAIAAAGGFTDKARPSKVVVRRMTKSGMKAYEFNVSKMQRDGSDRFFMVTGDTITVPESFF